MRRPSIRADPALELQFNVPGFPREFRLPLASAANGSILPAEPFPIALIGAVGVAKLSYAHPLANNASIDSNQRRCKRSF